MVHFSFGYTFNVLGSSVEAPVPAYRHAFKSPVKPGRQNIIRIKQSNPALIQCHFGQAVEKPW